MPRSEDEKETRFNREFISGNDLFNKAALVIGMDAVTTRRILAEALAKLGVKPSHTTMESLRQAVPHVEQAITTLVPPDVAARIMESVGKLVR